MTNRLSIRNRIYLATLFMLAFSYTLLFASSLFTINRFTEEQVAKDLESSLKFAKSQYMARPETVMEALKLPVSSDSVRNWILKRDALNLSDAIDRWTRSLDFLDILTVVDSEQSVIVRKSRKKETRTFLKGSLLASAFNRRQPFITTEIVSHDDYCQEVNDEACMVLPEKKEVMIQLVILPVISQDGTILGAVIAGNDLNKDSHLPYQQQKIFGKNVEMLVAQKGERIASTMGKIDALHPNLDQRVVGALKGGFSFNGTTTLDNRQFEMVAEPLHNLKGEFIGAIAVALEQGTFDGIRNENIQNLILCSAISLPLMFMLAYFVAQQVVLPFRRFSDAVEGIESGDYTKRVSVEGFHEIRAYYDSFNLMLESVEKRDKLLTNRIEQLLTLNKELENRIVAKKEELNLETGTQKAILESLLDGFLVIDGKQRILHVNSAAEELLGVNLSGMPEKQVLAYFDRVGLKELAASLKSASESSCTVSEKVIQARLGGKKLRFSITPLLEQGELCRRLLLGIRDVTRDGEVDQMKSEFIASVSHELKTPLTSMKGSLQFILSKGKWLTGVEREMLDVCRRNTERLIFLVNDIIDISRIEGGNEIFSMRPVDPGELVLYAIEMMKKGALARNISLVKDFEAELPQIWGDYDRLLQVLTNILSNAIKFSPQDTVITLTAEQKGRMLAISVADGGKVIKPSHRERLFTKFQKFSNAESGDSGGSGLGLAICRSIIEKHDGIIYYSPRVGGGNIFTFTVPVYGEKDDKNQNSHSG